MADIKKIIESFTKEEKEELKKLLNNQEIEDVNWEPTLDEDYYYIDEAGMILKVSWGWGTDAEQWSYSSGNLFASEEQANNYKKYLLMKKEIKDIIIENIGQKEYFAYCQLKAQFET